MEKEMTRAQKETYALNMLQEASYRHASADRTGQPRNAEYYYRIVIAVSDAYLADYDRVELEGIKHLAKIGLADYGENHM